MSSEPFRSFPLPNDRVFCVPEGAIIGLLRDDPPSIFIPASTTLLFTNVRLPVLAIERFLLTAFV